jgi:hypothetical protein
VSPEIPEILGPFLKPSFFHLWLILPADPLILSNARERLGPGVSGDSMGTVVIFAEDDTSVGLEITMAPRLVGFRSSLPLFDAVDGVRLRAAVAAAMRASKSRRTSASSTACFWRTLDARLAWLVDGV